MGFLTRIRWWCVLVGLSVDILGSMAGAHFIIGSRGGSSSFFLLLLVNGFIFSLLGAFLAARLAGRDEIIHALAEATLSILSEVAFHYMPTLPGTPEWYNTVGFLSILPIAFFGGWLAQVMRQKNQP